MKNLSPDFCRRIREERRNAGLKQTELAAAIGCKQSALSMFEQGDGTKLNDEAIRRLAERFKFRIEDFTRETESVGDEVPAAPVMSVAQAGTGFCPNPCCPSQHEYFVEARRLLVPDRAAQDPVGARYCAICGELLERRCPQCGAAVHAGAVCSFCGRAYVTVR